jgi:hypothetical protein
MMTEKAVVDDVHCAGCLVKEKRITQLKEENNVLGIELIQEQMRAAGVARHMIGDAFDFLMPKDAQETTIKHAIDELKALLIEESDFPIPPPSDEGEEMD